MIGSNDKSGGIYSGWGSCVHMEQNVAGSNLALCFDYFFQVLVGSLYIRRSNTMRIRTYTSAVTGRAHGVCALVL